MAVNNGILTKIRAMESKLLSQEDFDTILSMDSVTDIINYLHDKSNSKFLFDDSDDNVSHREQIEGLLNYSVYKDFKKLYKFASGSARTFLDIIFFRIEIEVLKGLLCNLHSNDKRQYSFYTNDFFSKHSEYNVNTLLAATTLEEFIDGLTNTKYYTLFKNLYEYGIINLFDYKTRLDIFYYQYIWKRKGKFLSGSLLDAVTDIFGREIDLQNIIWIYRCKKYYDIDSSIIYSNYIIPINYKLSKSDLSMLVDSSNIEEFISNTSKLYYGKHSIVTDFTNIDEVFVQMMLKQYSICIKKYPGSLVPLLYYIFRRQNETDRLTTAIECIRYKVKPE